MDILSLRLIRGLSPEHLDTLHLRNWETVLKILPQHIPAGPAVHVLGIATTETANLAKW